MDNTGNNNNGNKKDGKPAEEKKEFKYTDLPANPYISGTGFETGMVQESAASEARLPVWMRRKKQGEYTLEDYLSLPEEERWELIDGCLIRLEAPTTVHQFISARLLIVLSACMDAHGASCLALAAPIAVQLDMDERTIVEPDLVVLCDLKKLRRKRIYGAPDMLVEILSPSTHIKDMFWKNQKYQRAGVREYWIVDPDGKRVIVNLFAKTEGMFVSRVYSFDDSIPVGISEGKCTVDFSTIRQRLEKLYGKE